MHSARHASPLQQHNYIIRNLAVVPQLTNERTFSPPPFINTYSVQIECTYYKYMYTAYSAYICVYGLQKKCFRSSLFFQPLYDEFSSHFVQIDMCTHYVSSHS